MQIEEQYHESLNAITHSPYYGCTVRVVSKAHVSYEGVLDGISTNKDRIFLKNVRVNANITASDRNNSVHDLKRNSTSDTLNAVMLDHLTNDIRTYEQVCLNVRDIQELRLIQLPSTFHESKAKLRAIDPCLVDIRLSPSDEYSTRSNGSNNHYPPRAPIARQKRGESFGSNGGSELISSSSNESSSSFGLRSGERFADESNDESIDEQLEKLSQLRTTNVSSKSVTLLAKKVLPKKVERRTDAPSINTNNNLRPTFSDNRETFSVSTRVNYHNTVKKGPMINQNRNPSPIRVTITSNLNPNAVPFYTQQRNLPAIQNPSLTFYERSRFRPPLQPVASSDRSQSMPYGINAINNNNKNHHHHHYQQQQQQQQQQNQHHSHQRFVPPRHMANKINFTQTNTRPIRGTPPPPIMKYRLHPSASLDKRSYPQQQQQQYKRKTSNNVQFPGYMRQTSLPGSNQLTSTLSMDERFSVARNHPGRQSTASIRSTTSLPFQYGSSGDRNQIQTPISFGEPIGSHRSQRTVSGASSSSSLSLDIGPHSIVQLDSSSSSNALTSFQEQYDFEKANEEFRRYLELEELVSRCTPPRCSTEPSPDDNSTQQEQEQSQSNSYKKETSFFDRISCTATTGTAVGYTEMDETEKNLETFGDDALLIPPKSNDGEW